MANKKSSCSGKHWLVVEGKLLLTTETEEEQELAKQVIKVLDQQIRQQIYNDICAWEPLKNRRQIMKIVGSLDAALLGVQAICADIALGKKGEEADE